MADYTITELEIDGQRVRVGDWIEFTHDDGNYVGVVTEFDDHEDGVSVVLGEEGVGARPIFEISSVTRLPPVPDNAGYPSAWDRVLDGEGPP